ncbi:MAG: lamin tail domain-containing protein [Bacteroidota bacterium]
MKKLYFLICFLLAFSGFSQNVTITKVIETGCSSPFVKTVELYVDGTVDFSTEVVLNYMQNGAPWADNQIDISALGTVTDSFVYIVRDIALMQTEFPSTTFNATNTVVVSTSTNGDDGYQIVLNGTIVSQFGRTETDADNDTNSNWNHNDAVATRLSNPDLGTWNPSDWVITAENDLDDHTACQAVGSSPNLETYFNTLGGNYPLGSGSGWTPTGTVCTTTLGSTSTNCDSTTSGATDDTYTATVDFVGGNNGNAFVVNSTAGTVSGDNPTSVASGTITITGIPEGTDIMITVDDTADGGVCSLSTDIDSPGCIPLLINEVLFDPDSDNTAGDANGDGTRDALEDEFIEFYNNSNSPLDISGYTISDGAALRHTFPASTIIPANSILVVFGGGTPTGSFGGAIVQTASEGELNLSNSGDTITVQNPSNDIVLLYVSADTGISHSQNQSVTRNPDFTGSFVLHTDANASLLFSPGLLVNGAILSSTQFEVDYFSIYPNPSAYDYVNITSKDSGNITVSIFDITGKQVSLSQAPPIQVCVLSQPDCIVKIVVFGYFLKRF